MLHRWPIVGALLLAPACLGAGQPWAYVDLEMENTWEIPSARLEADGLLRTSQSYGIDVHGFSYDISGSAITLTSLAASGFDEANPPEGYTLCHNGHCHAVSGALVSYEDIIAELEGSSGGTPLAISWYFENGADLSPLEGEEGLDLEDASTSAILNPGEAANYRVYIQSLRLDFTVYDLTGTRDYPADGVRFTLEAPGPLILDGPISAQFDRHSPLNWLLSAQFDPGISLFDGVDWLNLPQTPGTHQLSSEGDAHQLIINQFGVVRANITPNDP